MRIKLSEAKRILKAAERIRRKPSFRAKMVAAYSDWLRKLARRWADAWGKQ